MVKKIIWHFSSHVLFFFKEKLECDRLQMPAAYIGLRLKLASGISRPVLILPDARYSVQHFLLSQHSSGAVAHSQKRL